MPMLGMGMTETVKLGMKGALQEISNWLVSLITVALPGVERRQRPLSFFKSQVATKCFSEHMKRTLTSWVSSSNREAQPLNKAVTASTTATKGLFKGE